MEDEAYLDQRAMQAAVPELLRNHRRWCTWRLEQARGSSRYTKVPDQSTLQIDQCRPFSAVAGTTMSSQGGIGFVWTGGVRAGAKHRLLALDLDACVDPATGDVSAWANDALEWAGSYAELSPSGAGIRVFVLVPEAEIPRAIRQKVRISAPAPAGVDKAPELQLFGLGPAGYTTVSGRRIGHEVAVNPAKKPFAALLLRFGLDEIEQTPAELPAGQGAMPSPEELLGAVAAEPGGHALIEGRWKEATGTKSASEGFFALTRIALRCARGHGLAVVEFLLSHTAWGKGMIDDSADPARYTRRDWVEKDVARTAARGAGDAGGFEPLDADLPSAAAPGESGFEVLDGDAPPPPAAKLALFDNHAQFVSAANAQAWLVKGLIPRTGLVQFFGDPASGKTPFAMSLMLHVAGNQPTWFDRKVARHGRVIYMIGEDAHGLRWRAIAEQKRMGLTTEQLGDRVFWSRQPGQLCDTEDAKRWLAQIRLAVPEGPAMVVVDTQSRNFGNGDENSTQDMAKFVHHLAELSRVLGCCVLIVHHTGHANKDRARGSMVMFGALDGSYRIENEGGTVRAFSTKAKNWAEPAPLVGQLVPQQVGTDEDGDPITAITLVTEAPPALPEGVVGEAPPIDDPARSVLVAVSELQGDRVGFSDLARESGVARSGVVRAVDQLVAAGLVEVVSKTPKGSVYGLTERGAAEALLS